jgi:glycosyltransferase involved in cell wall biosynthesis
MESLFSRLATRLLAVGEAQRQQLRNVYRFRDRTIGTVLNGVMKACGTDDGSFRARIGADNRILVGTIATLIEQKGLQDLLAVASQFRDSDNRIRFVIVGEGRLRPALEAMRRDLGLEDIVVFTGWLTNASEVALPAFDIFFQPSLWEAMSIAILEAMAAGKPVVATRVGETPYVIKDEVDGLLVDPKNVTGMVVALRRLIDDPALRRRLGDAAARKVAERFTVEQMTRSYEDIYQSAVHEKYA